MLGLIAVLIGAGIVARLAAGAVAGRGRAQTGRQATIARGPVVVSRVERAGARRGAEAAWREAAARTVAQGARA